MGVYSIIGLAKDALRLSWELQEDFFSSNMLLDSGCSMSSLRAPTIKLESLRYQLSNLRSTFSFGRQALRRIHVVPRIPANGSFSRKSLAYVHVSTRYIKQVSGFQLYAAVHHLKKVYKKHTLVCWNWKVQLKRIPSECYLNLVKPMSSFQIV